MSDVEYVVIPACFNYNGCRGSGLQFLRNAGRGIFASLPPVSMVNERNSADLSRLSIPDKKAVPFMRKKRFLGVLGVIAAAAILLPYLLKSSGDNPAGIGAAPLPAGTVSVSSGPHRSSILNATGYVVAQRSAAVSSKATGRLKELNIKEGDLVTKGQILGVLENDDLQAAVRESEAAVAAAMANVSSVQAELQEAKLHRERIEQLRKSSFSSQSDLDTARTRVLKNEAQLDAANAQVSLSQAALSRVRTELEYTCVRAPFDGTVLKKFSEVGEIVAPFGSSTNARAAIATLADMHSLQVEADVNESNLSKVFVGQECSIVLDSVPDHTYRGVVDKIVPTVDRAKATVLTKIRFVDLDSRVIPEMSAKVEFKLKES